MDFLGLSNLTVLKNALRIIKKVYGKEIDLAKIPIDDKKTYELLSRAETTGVFQLESSGMKRYIKELKPNCFEDIVAMVALYRPGPMQFIDDFIARKHGRKEITYDHPLMENALKNTYGVIVYQEQLMQVSKDMAGFTGGEADVLRKAMGKKIASLMAEMRQKFIEGSAKINKVDKKISSKIFDDFENMTKAISILESESGYRFVYNNSLVPDSKKVQANFYEADLPEVMDSWAFLAGSSASEAHRVQSGAKASSSTPHPHFLGAVLLP
jgi:DNA polymerase-3 subunit alpha